MDKIACLIKSIREFTTDNIQEMVDKEAMLELLKTDGQKAFSRNNTAVHMTASAIVINKYQTKVLFAFHLLYQSYAWLGGHADGEVDLYLVALKEAMEESGLKNLTPYSKNIVSLEMLPVDAHFKHGVYCQSHLHANLTYVFIGDESEKLTIKRDENSSLKWLPFDKIDEFVSEKRMLPIYKKIFARIAKEV